MTKEIQYYYSEEQNAIVALDFATIERMAKFLQSAKEKNQKIFICGNGGSASTASHFYNDLIKAGGLSYTQVFCLNDNIPLVTALANDISYDLIFLKQIENLIHRDDILFCISTSGNSKNILNAAEYAKTREAKVLSITGDYTSLLEKNSFCNVRIKSQNCRIIEDIQTSVCHVLVQCLIKEE